MKRFLASLLSILLACSALGQSQSVTVRPDGQGNGTFNTRGVSNYIFPAGTSVTLPSTVTTVPITLTLASIAALRAYNVTNPIIPGGTGVMVAGYYAANDGGGGIYVWNSASTAMDNGGTIIAPTGVATGRWLLQTNGAPLSVLQFGAVTSASAPSSSVQTANLNAIQAAVNTGLPVVLPAVASGGYFINGTLNLGTGPIDGSNFGGQIFETASGVAVTLNASGTNGNLTGISINKSPYDSTFADTTGVGLSVTGLRVSNPSVYVTGFYTGIKITSSSSSGAAYFSENKCYFRAPECFIGMSLSTSGTGFINSNSFYDFYAGQLASDLSGSRGLSIDSSASNSSSIQDNVFVRPDIEKTETPVYIEAGTGSPNGYSFYEPYFEGNTYGFRLPHSYPIAIVIVGGAYTTVTTPITDYGNAGNNIMLIDPLRPGTWVFAQQGTYRGGSSLGNSQAFKNLLVNGGFDWWSSSSSALGWAGTYTQEGTIVKEGSYSLHLANSTGSTSNVNETVFSGTPLAYYKGRTMTIAGWVYCDNAAGAALEIDDGVSPRASYTTATSTWQYIKVTATLSASASQFVARLVNGGTSGATNNSYFDGVTLVEGDNAPMFAPNPATDGPANATNTATVTAAGTPYTLTSSSAQVVFGTTSPVMTLPTAGTYLLTAKVETINSTSTTCNAGYIQYNFYRSNNTPGGQNGIYYQWHPAQSSDNTYDDTRTLTMVYTTATAGDIIQLYGWYTGTVSSGGFETYSVIESYTRLF